MKKHHKLVLQLLTPKISDFVALHFFLCKEEYKYRIQRQKILIRITGFIPLLAFLTPTQTQKIISAL